MLRQALPTTNQAMTAAVPFLCWSLSDLSYDVVLYTNASGAAPQLPLERQMILAIITLCLSRSTAVDTPRFVSKA